MHKRVCGSKSTPFRWPGLDSAELVESSKLATATMSLKPRSRRPAVTYTWLQGLAKNHDWPEDPEERARKWEVSPFSLAASRMKPLAGIPHAHPDYRRTLKRSRSQQAAKHNRPNRISQCSSRTTGVTGVRRLQRCRSGCAFRLYGVEVRTKPVGGILSNRKIVRMVLRLSASIPDQSRPPSIESPDRSATSSSSTLEVDRLRQQSMSNLRSG